MSCFITFLEGMITFISPCVLPMIPVYALYFTAGPQTGKAGRALMRALGFVLGFTLLFVALGVFAATLGSLLAAHPRAVNLVTGAVVVLFGLHHLEAFPIDVWIKRALKENFPKGFDPTTLGEYAGLAQQYIFYYARSHGK